MNAPVPRNAPCPCGSGRRYKDCHGKLAAVPPDAPEAILERALASHRRGAVDEAERGYREVLEKVPGHPVATHYLGMAAWQRGDVAQAERALRASLAADGTVADFHNNLGLLLRDQRRIDEAVAAFEQALRLEPRWADAWSNLGLAMEADGRWESAREACERALEIQPGHAVAHQNLARVLLALGFFAQAWPHYRWRLVAQGLSPHPPSAAERPLPASLAGRRFALLSEQGIGDVLFFLRFAPELVRRGAVLAFRGDARLHAMLERTGLFAAGLATDDAGAGDLEPVHVGDLPWLLEANDATRLPPPLALAVGGKALPPRADSAQVVALTWRAGVESVGPARTQVKQIAPRALGAMLRGRAARWVSIQRLPRPGERESLQEALGAQVEDRSALNDDLDAMLAFLAAADDYVGVSNANTHLRAGLRLPATVLVPHPPEWRWMASGDASPWFPGVKVLRIPSGSDS